MFSLGHIKQFSLKYSLVSTLNLSSVGVAFTRVDSASMTTKCPSWVEDFLAFWTYKLLRLILVNTRNFPFSRLGYSSDTFGFTCFKKHFGIVQIRLHSAILLLVNCRCKITFFKVSRSMGCSFNDSSFSMLTQREVFIFMIIFLHILNNVVIVLIFIYIRIHFNLMILLILVLLSRALLLLLFLLTSSTLLTSLTLNTALMTILTWFWRFRWLVLLWHWNWTGYFMFHLIEIWW